MSVPPRKRAFYADWKKWKRVEPYKAYAVGADGKRKAIRTYELAVDFGGGKEIEINFAPHPNFAGRITVATYERECLLLEPSAGDGVRVSFTGRRHRSFLRKGRGRWKQIPPYAAYLVARDGDRTPIEAGAFTVEILRGVELTINLAPPRRFAGYLEITARNYALDLLLGAGNVVHVGVLHRRLRRRR